MHRTVSAGFGSSFSFTVSAVLGKVIRHFLHWQHVRSFRQRNYTSFLIFHTVSGLLDDLDGPLARTFNQLSYVGLYFETILDQFSHVLTYSYLGFLYPKYIVFFFAEIALELWSSTFSLFAQSLPKTEQKWPEEPSFLARACHVPSWEHPNLRWYRWYGSDLFHTFLIVRYILIHQSDLPWVQRLKRYASIKRIFTGLRYLIIFMGISTFFRTVLGSFYLFYHLQRLGAIEKAQREIIFLSSFYQKVSVARTISRCPHVSVFRQLISFVYHIPYHLIIHHNCVVYSSTDLHKRLSQGNFFLPCPALLRCPALIKASALDVLSGPVRVKISFACPVRQGKTGCPAGRTIFQ